jgi:hypothetical protein
MTPLFRHPQWWKRVAQIQLDAVLHKIFVEELCHFKINGGHDLI